MKREKIFRLHRPKSSLSYSSAGTDASAQKFYFTFSNIQANQDHEWRQAVTAAGSG